MMKKFRLVSYNICSAHFAGGHYTEQNLHDLADTLKDPSFDAVCLQEVDKGAARSEGVDMTARLAELAGYTHTYFIKIRDFQGGEYGTAILSRFPITSFSVTPLPGMEGCEDRSIGHAVIELDGEALHVFNTHLAFERLDLKRKQLEHIAPMIERLDRFLLMGDFNLEDVEELAVFKGARTLNERAFATYYPSGWAIDHIMIPASVTAGKVEMPTPPYSDHYPLVADLYL